MAVLLWYCCLTLGAVVLAALARSRSPKPSVLPVEAPAATEASPQAAARALPRSAAQTSAAIMAIALALDVSSAAQGWELESPVSQTVSFAALGAPASNLEPVWLPSSAEGGWFV